MRTNRRVLDQADPRELVLELLSFSGGENTVGEDQELANNEARSIENWQSDSLGGMIRNKGFSKIAEGSLATLLSRFDGADEATAYTAETGQVITFGGTAQLDTSQKKYGTASVLFDGNSDYVTVPDSPDWNFGTGKFMIGFRVRFKTIQSCTFIGQGNGAPGWSFAFFTPNNLRFNVGDNGGGSISQKTVTWTPVVDTWYHIVITRNGTTDSDWKIFIDGVSQTFNINTGSGVDILNFVAPLTIGAFNEGAASFVDGWMDEIRIVKGAAIWTADFTPPSGGLITPGEIDLTAEHLDEVFVVAGGDLGLLSSGYILVEDAAAFTSGVLCNAISAGGDLWITNLIDNIKYKTISSAIAVPSGVPTASARVSEMNNRLIVEGNTSKTVEGSRVGIGNWKGADAWSKNNDAWSMVLPARTRGHVAAFPSGTEYAVFTDQDVYVIYNQPGVFRRKITNGIGCHAPYSIAKGNEGVFFLSNSPTLGIFLWDSVSFINLTEKNDFVEDVNLDGRIFGVYRDKKYYFFYNEIGSGVSYTNRLKIYDTRLGRWHTRPINSNVADNFGYPALLTLDDNKIYVGSSRQDVIYELDDASTSDNGEDTEADFKTKIMTSRDFAQADGRVFPLDNVRLKLLKIVVTVKGNVGNLIISWDIDRGKRTGSKSFDISQGQAGDLLNTTFTLNVSDIIAFGNVEDKVKKQTFPNSAIGRAFQFDIINSGTGIRTEVKKLKIYAKALQDI